MDELQKIKLNQIESSVHESAKSLPEITRNAQNIFLLLPPFMEFMSKNVELERKLQYEYSRLPQIVRETVDIYTPIEKDHHRTENDLIYLKDKIFSIVGMIDVTETRLKQYWTIIHELNHETIRLENNLTKSQLLISNHDEIQQLQDQQRVYLDRTVKENEKVKNEIDDFKKKVKITQISIETGVKELQILRSNLNDITHEREYMELEWTQIVKEGHNLRVLIEYVQELEIEYKKRMETTEQQYELVRSQLKHLSLTYDQTEYRSDVMKHEQIDLNNDIEITKRNLTNENVRLSLNRAELEKLKRKYDDQENTRRQIQKNIRVEEQTCYCLEKKRRIMENIQEKLMIRTQSINNRVVLLTKQIDINKKEIKENNKQIATDQEKTFQLENMKRFVQNKNANLQQNLSYCRGLRLIENEKLNILKQISFRKRKEFIFRTRRLQLMTNREKQLISDIQKMFTNIIKYHKDDVKSKLNISILERDIRRKHAHSLRGEKTRAALILVKRDCEDMTRLIDKKNQLIESEVNNKMEKYNSLIVDNVKRKNEQTTILKDKIRHTYLYRSNLLIRQKIQFKRNHQEKLIIIEKKQILTKINENKHLRSKIALIKQQMLIYGTTIKRLFDESSLLKEKISLYENCQGLYAQNQERFVKYKTSVEQLSHQIFLIRNDNFILRQHLIEMRKVWMKAFVLKYDLAKNQQYLYQLIQSLINRPCQLIDIEPINIEKLMKKYKLLIGQLMNKTNAIILWRQKLIEQWQWYMIIFYQLQEQIYKMNKKDSITNIKSGMIVRYDIQKEFAKCKAIKAENILCTNRKKQLSLEIDYCERLKKLFKNK